MRLLTSDLHEIDAAFDIGPIQEDGRFGITIESAGGSAVSGGTRNPDYPRLLEELLRRAAGLGASIEDAVVDSRRVAGLSEEERRIHIDGRPYPFTAGPSEDFEELRRSFTRPQGDIGSSRKVGGGNQRKRITITFGMTRPVDRLELMRNLRAVEVASRLRRTGLASGLTQAQVEAAIERWRAIGQEAFLAEFGAPRAHKYVVVDGDFEIDAMALLLGARAMAGLDVEGPWRGDRVNVAVPLRELGFGVDDLEHPREAPLGGDPAKYVDLASRLGGTDVALKRMGRREQRYLRGALGIGSGDPHATGTCGMCGRVLPESLLVAAHIKPRHLCTDAERLDMPSVGWPLCLLGCDALFEQGFVSVTHGGRVEALRGLAGLPPDLRKDVELLVETVAVGWTSSRQGYFHAHRKYRLSRD